jgi:Fe-S cluster assembly ATPase SufC
MLQAGKIIYTGSIDVADVLEKDGYAGIRRLINESA